MRNGEANSSPYRDGMRGTAALLVFAAALGAVRAAELPSFPEARWNVRDFGAKADTKTNDSQAINAAIAKCNENGGGSVVFPAGRYAAASIHLRSNVRLLLDDNAIITAARDGYDPPEPNPFERFQDFGHSHFHNALMWGENIGNFAIVGGRVNGGGGLVEDERDNPRGGDKLIAIKSGRRLLFQNLRHEKGAHFIYLLNDCEQVTLDRVSIEQSRDGINLVSCRDVEVRRCRIAHCGDDALALKSDYALGRKIDCANIRVSDCFLSCAGNTMQIGSESVGDFRDIAFSHIEVGRAEKAAIGVTCADGGVVDGVSYSDISVKNAECPIFLRVNDRLRSGEAPKKIGAIRNITISDLNVSECKPARDVPVSPSIISGKPESRIDNVSLEKVKIISAGGGAKPESTSVPEPKGHAHKALALAPAAAFFITNTNNLKLRDVELAYDKPDARPSIAISDADGFTVENLRAQKTGDAVLRLDNVARLSLRDSPPLRDRSEERASSLAISE